jgi:hypothetical protein
VLCGDVDVDMRVSYPIAIRARCAAAITADHNLKQGRMVAPHNREGGTTARAGGMMRY